MNSRGSATGLVATTELTTLKSKNLLPILPLTCLIKTATTRTTHLLTNKCVLKKWRLNRSILRKKEFSNLTETFSDGSLWSNTRRNTKNAKISGGKNIRLVNLPAAVTVIIF
jgi:hypothetical protein